MHKCVNNEVKENILSIDVFMTSSYYGTVEVISGSSDIRAGNVYSYTEAGNMFYDDSEKAKFLREAYYHLSKMVDSSIDVRFSVWDELHKLMSSLNLMAESEFSNFYNFVFFMCRERGQKNISVSSAITAWKTVLSGRFRLLDKWCKFVEKNQRHNIPEDTWHQVLAFSRQVPENLDGYDPEGAWPTLIDDFVEHMYRITGSNNCSSQSLTCSCDDLESISSKFEESLSGLKNLPGSKRKLWQKTQENNVKSSLQSEMGNSSSSCKRRKQQHHIANVSDEEQQTVIVNPLSLSNCPCAVEGCLPKGFSGLFSSRRVRNQEQRASYT